MPEILSPCGNMESFYAACCAGSDAVYLAGKMFGARAFSNNFNEDELVYIINYAHKYGIKVYVTCNILIYEKEVDKFLEFVRFLHKNNVDALIMQDLGMIDLVHKKFPNLELHGSTQMNIHNLEGAMMAERLGLKRIVLARETPISIIKEIKEKTSLEIEVFVHGALCASYSGMCLFARSIGNRSGNRGTCSGCCRLPYTLEDEKGHELMQGYPLSMKDLMTLENLKELIDLGIDSFKIEGRMKSPSYVYTTTKMYKETRDNYLKTGEIVINQEDFYNLQNIFTRNYTKGFIFNDSSLSNPNSPNHIGIHIGNVIDYKNNYITIKLVDDVSILDGLRIINKNFEYGLILNEFKKNNQLIKEGHKNDLITLKVNKNIPLNSKVMRTYSSKIEKEISEKIQKNTRKVPIDVSVKIKANKPIEMSFSDHKNIVTIKGIIPSPAIKKSTGRDEIEEKIRKINNTIYEIENLEIEIDECLFIPISEINSLRRACLSKLDTERINNFNKNFKENDYNISLKDYPKENKHAFLKDYKYTCSGLTILKIPKIVNNYQKYSKEKEYLVGEIGSLVKFSNVISDYSFNVTNSYTVALLHFLGVKRVTLSLELSDLDIKDLIENYLKRYQKKPNLELITRCRIEVMVLKLDLFQYGNVKYLVDRFKNKYLVLKKDNLVYIYDYKETKREKSDEYYFDLGINVLREEII